MRIEVPLERLAQGGDLLAHLSARQVGVGGTKLALSSPASASWHNHAASDTSVLRPGTCLTWRALTNRQSNSSSRIAHGARRWPPSPPASHRGRRASRA